MISAGVIFLEEPDNRAHAEDETVAVVDAQDRPLIQDERLARPLLRDDRGQQFLGLALDADIVGHRVHGAAPQERELGRVRDRSRIDESGERVVQAAVSAADAKDVGVVFGETFGDRAHLLGHVGLVDHAVVAHDLAQFVEPAGKAAVLLGVRIENHRDSAHIFFSNPA